MRFATTRLRPTPPHLVLSKNYVKFRSFVDYHLCLPDQNHFRSVIPLEYYQRLVASRTVHLAVVSYSLNPISRQQNLHQVQHRSPCHEHVRTNHRLCTEGIPRVPHTLRETNSLVTVLISFLEQVNQSKHFCAWLEVVVALTPHRKDSSRRGDRFLIIPIHGLFLPFSTRSRFFLDWLRTACFSRTVRSVEVKFILWEGRLLVRS